MVPVVSFKSLFSSKKLILSHRNIRLIKSFLECAEKIIRVKWKGLPARW